jgi:very-short-patch-repair endonuclease
MRRVSHLSSLRTITAAHHAKQLRREMTDAEKKLWHYLRAHRLRGRGFRRQVPLGPYVADFLCESHCLIVEVDGSQHMEHQRHDAERTQWLLRHGYRVVRFWNNDVLENVSGVLERIASLLA